MKLYDNEEITSFALSADGQFVIVGTKDMCKERIFNMHIHSMRQGQELGKNLHCVISCRRVNGVGVSGYENGSL